MSRVDVKCCVLELVHGKVGWYLPSKSSRLSSSPPPTNKKIFSLRSLKNYRYYTKLKLFSVEKYFYLGIGTYVPNIRPAGLTTISELKYRYQNTTQNRFLTSEPSKQYEKTFLPS
jgi:hypothetical protein